MNEVKNRPKNNNILYTDEDLNMSSIYIAFTKDQIYILSYNDDKKYHWVCFDKIEFFPASELTVKQVCKDFLRREGVIRIISMSPSEFYNLFNELSTIGE